MEKTVPALLVEKKVSIMLEELGSAIKEARLDLGLSERKAAQLVGVTSPTYNKIEQGSGLVMFETVLRTVVMYSSDRKFKANVIKILRRNIL